MRRKTAKEILADTFREIAEYKPVDKITVNDITENSGYSTATFYRQFKDKYDLIAWDYTRDLERILKQSVEGKASWTQRLSGAAEYYDSHKNYLANLLLNTTGYDSFLRYMSEIHYGILTDLILKAAGTDETDPETAMLIRTYSLGTVAITCEWILGKFPVSSDVLKQVYEKSFPTALTAFIKL